MPEVTPFEMPKFEIPKFEMPKIEFPPAFREFAEKNIAQTKETYEKVRTAAENTTGFSFNAKKVIQIPTAIKKTGIRG